MNQIKFSITQDEYVEYCDGYRHKVYEAFGKQWIVVGLNVTDGFDPMTNKKAKYEVELAQVFSSL